MSEQLSHKPEQNTTDSLSGLSNNQLRALVSAADTVNTEESPTPHADMRTALREGLEAAGYESAFKLIHGKNNLELDSLVSQAGVEATNRHKQELQNIIDTYDSHESFADRRTALRELLESTGETDAFKQVFNKNNLEITAFVNKARQELADLNPADKIEEASNESSDSSKPEVDKAADAEESKADTLDEANEKEEEINQSEAFDPHKALDEASDRLSDEIDKRAQAAIDSINDTEQAKADRELLQPISVDDMEEFPEDSNETDATEPISAEELEEFPEEETNEVDALEHAPGRRGRRSLMDRINSVRAAFTARRYQASDWLHRTPEGSQEKLNKRKVAVVALGVIGTVAALWGLSKGINLLKDDSGQKAEAASGAIPNKLPTEGTDQVVQSTGTEAVPSAAPETVFSPEAHTVKPGEGWYQTFKDMGIPQSEWSAKLTTKGPGLVERGWAYFDEQAKEFRISRPGQLPDDVLKFISE